MIYLFDLKNLSVVVFSSVQSQWVDVSVETFEGRLAILHTFRSWHDALFFMGSYSYVSTWKVRS